MLNTWTVNNMKEIFFNLLWNGKSWSWFVNDNLSKQYTRHNEQHQPFLQYIIIVWFYYIYLSIQF